MRIARPLLAISGALMLTTAACSENVAPSDSTQRILFVSNGAATVPAGQLLTDIYRMRADGTGLENLTRFPDDYSGLDATRNGTVIFGVTHSFTSGLVNFCPTQIWRMTADGSDRRAITGGSTCSTNPRLSPDDARLAYQRGTDIYVSTLDGTGETLLTAGLPAVDPTPCGATPKVTVHLTGWIDVDRVSFWRYICQGGQTNYTVRADGADLQVVDASGPQLGWLSPDRRQLAYVLGGQLWVRNRDGSGAHALAAVGTYSADGYVVDRSPWSPDGAWVYFVDAAGKPSVVSADGASIRPLRAPINTIFGGWSADGSQIAWTDYGVAQASIVVTRSDGTGLVPLPGAGAINRDARWIGTP